MNNRFGTYLLTVLMLLTCVHIDTVAQKFKVSSFRILPNDVSAFINPVRDLNDEDCALIKVQGNEDFVFSTPLGIIKRIDSVGEIWLYRPSKSKKITIKHPEWGVLRDYYFPERIDSHLTYELKIAEPAGSLNTQNTPEPIIRTVRDTLVITHTDTLIMQPAKPRIPLVLSAIATVGFGGRSKTVAGGVLISLMKRHGGFIHVASDFGKTGKLYGECDRHGVINGTIPFYSPVKYHSFFMANAGAMHRLSGKFAFYEGIGYASNTIAWQLADSEGGKRVKNSYYSHKGISFEVGLVFYYKRLSFSSSVSSIKGKDWFGSIGVGINISK